MLYRCRYCHKEFTRSDNKDRHERNSCASATTRGSPFVVNNHPFPPGTVDPIQSFDLSQRWCEGFKFKTPSSILIVGPSGCGKTYFTKSLLLQHLDELFVSPPTVLSSCTGSQEPIQKTKQYTIANR